MDIYNFLHMWNGNQSDGTTKTDVFSHFPLREKRIVNHSASEQFWYRTVHSFNDHPFIGVLFPHQVSTQLVFVVQIICHYQASKTCQKEEVATGLLLCHILCYSVIISRVKYIPQLDRAVKELNRKPGEFDKGTI